jgi:hypothetical protein
MGYLLIGLMLFVLMSGERRQPVRVISITPAATAPVDPRLGKPIERYPKYGPEQP